MVRSLAPTGNGRISHQQEHMIEGSVYENAHSSCKTEALLPVVGQHKHWYRLCHHGANKPCSNGASINPIASVNSPAHQGYLLHLSSTPIYS